MDITDTNLILIFGLIPFIGVYIVAKILRNTEEKPEIIEEYDESD